MRRARFPLVSCLFACLAAWSLGHETSMLPHDDRMLVLISGAFPFIVPSPSTYLPWPGIPPHYQSLSCLLPAWHAVRTQFFELTTSQRNMIYYVGNSEIYYRDLFRNFLYVTTVFWALLYGGSIWKRILNKPKAQRAEVELSLQQSCQLG